MTSYNKYPEPLYEEISALSVNQLVEIFSFKKDLMVLSSSMVMEGYGRYSFVCFDRFACFYSKGDACYWNNEIINVVDPFDFVCKQIEKYKLNTIDFLPPLQGGVVGYFGYEASHYLENLPIVRDNINLPDIYLNFYGTIISIDHILNRCWIVSTGFPEELASKRSKNAKANILEIKNAIFNQTNTTNKVYRNNSKESCVISSNFTRQSYIEAVKKTKEFILSGDIYEANITQQFSTTLSNNKDVWRIYSNLMNTNPAPFSSFMRICDDGWIISASPERFIKLTGDLMEACPIKGTRKRSCNDDEDRLLANQLLSSEKDRAENIMIVDLMRNDISRVCQSSSVVVDELCALKSFETVHHLVSKISGKLKESLNAMDILKATFPPGSVTGAPKIRAMEIISELESLARGPYCGCLGYISFTGDLDMSVTIRTYFINKNKLFFSAGGAVVLDSDPEEEYEESLTKAKALVGALTL